MKQVCQDLAHVELNAPRRGKDRCNVKQHVTDFQVVDHGIEHSQYFQGCGTAFTTYSGVVTGIGANPREALEDALEQIATMGYEPPSETAVVRVWRGPRCKVAPTHPSCHHRTDADERYYHLSIRFNVSEEHVTGEKTPPIVLPENPLRHGKDCWCSKCKPAPGGHTLRSDEPQGPPPWYVGPTYQPTEDEVMDAVNRCETDA